jgi:acyl dehydratase
MNLDPHSPEVGDDIPELSTAPISRLTLALYAGASGDHNPIHVDLDFARYHGMTDVFAHGMLVTAYLGRMLSNWVPQQAIRSFAVRFVAICEVHDQISCKGRILEKITANDETLIKVELTASNQHGVARVVGDALVALR